MRDDNLEILFQEIEQWNDEQLDKAIFRIIKRYDQINPDWECSLIFLPRKEPLRSKYIDELADFLKREKV